MVLGYICRHIQYVFDITMGQRVFGVYTTDIQYMPHMYSKYVYICPIQYMPHTYVARIKNCDMVVGLYTYIHDMPQKYVLNS